MFIEGISKETEERSRVSLREAVEIMARSLEELSRQNLNSKFQIRFKRFSQNPPSKDDWTLPSDKAESIRLDSRGRVTFPSPRRLKIFGAKPARLDNPPGTIQIEKINDDGTVMIIDSATLVYGHPNHEVYELSKI